MRTLSARDQKLLAAGSYSVHVRVRIKDGTGTFQDYRTLRGINWIRSVEYSENLDNPTAQATVRLSRDQFNYSTSPLVANSVLNLSAPAIDVGREIIVETATLPLAATPATADWRMVFHGYIDEIDWGSPVLELQCRDLAARLQDTFIEVQRDYGRWEANRVIRLSMVVTPVRDPADKTSFQYWRCIQAGNTGSTEPTWPALPTPGQQVTDTAGVSPAVWAYLASTAWQAGNAYSLSSVVHPTANPNQQWICTQAGTSAGAQPSWPSTPGLGTTMTDSTVIWTYLPAIGGTQAEVVLQSLLDDNPPSGGSAPTLAAPAPSGWYLRRYTQQKDNVFAALSAIALQLGWTLRYAWNEASQDFLLTFQSVPRTPGAPVWSFSGSVYRQIKKCSRSVLGIRNAVSVVYSDVNTNDPTTNAPPLRTTQSATDAASITKYGRRYMEVAEASSSQISDAVTASNFAAAMLSDLKEPLLEQEVTLPYFWPVQLNDYCTFLANNRHYDGDQSLAVVSISHSLSEDSQSTTLGVRGKPTAGVLRYHDVAAVPGNGRQIAIKALSTPVITVAQTVGGVIVTVNPPADTREKWGAAELHLSQINGFTPGSGTLVASGNQTHFEVTGLTSGSIYYARAILRDRSGNPSSPSAQQTVSIGYVQQSHLLPNSINADRLINQSITATQIANATITGTQVASGAITATQIATGTITATQISSSAGILGSQLSSSAGILGSQLSSGAGIVGTQLSSTAGLLGSQLSSSAAILGSQLSSSAGILGSQLSASAGIVGTQLASATITGTQLATNAVATSHLSNLSVTSAKLESFLRASMKVGLTADVTYPGNDVLITWSTPVETDVANAFDTSLKQRWTCKVAGRYRIYAQLSLTGAQAGDRFRAYTIVNVASPSSSTKYMGGTVMASSNMANTGEELFAVIDYDDIFAVNDTVTIGSLFSGGATTKTLKMEANNVAGSFFRVTPYAYL